MIRKTCVVIPIITTDASLVGHARRQGIAMASAMGFSELKQAQIGIIVTEAAGNIAAHAAQGELLLCPWEIDGSGGIDVLAIDNGHGIKDVARSFEDGFSTAGTAGQGLGAVSRLSSFVQIYTSQGKGTVLLARVLKDSEAAGEDVLALGAICLPISGETACGDAWSVSEGKTRSIYIVADGLGHGPLAAEASREAIRIFEEFSHLSPSRILTEAHGALGKTRGAAVSIAEVEREKGVINYAGIGNVAGAILHNGKSRSMVSMNGTLGHTIGKIQQFSYPWTQSSSLLMHSDGLGTRWKLDQYPGLLARHPSLIAGVLYRDFCRKRDDVTILVTRI